MRITAIKRIALSMGWITAIICLAFLIFYDKTNDWSLLPLMISWMVLYPTSLIVSIILVFLRYANRIKALNIFYIITVSLCTCLSITMIILLIVDGSYKDGLQFIGYSLAGLIICSIIIWEIIMNSKSVTEN